MAPADTPPADPGVLVPEGGQGLLAELLGQVALGDIGLSGLVILAVLMVLTGKLVPGKRYEEARQDAQAYREAADKKDAVNAELKDAVKELLQLGRATHHALTEIQNLGERSAETQGGST